MVPDPSPPPPPEPAIEAVVFDFDGTLVDSRFVDEAAVGELIALDPSATAGAGIFWSHDGEPLLTRIETAWPGRSAEVLPLFQRPTAPRLFPGITSLLDAMQGAGLAMAVVSSRRLAALRQGLEATGLLHHFPVVVGLEDVAQPKPSPEGLLLALRRLGAEPPRAVFVGDNELDVEAGHRAGVTVWRAVWGLPSLHTVPESPNGTVLLHRPEEVGERLERLSRR